MNLENMTTAELKSLQAEISEQLVKHQRHERFEALDNLMEAIENFRATYPNAAFTFADKHEGAKTIWCLNNLTLTDWGLTENGGFFVDYYC